MSIGKKSIIPFLSLCMLSASAQLIYDPVPDLRFPENFTVRRLYADRIFGSFPEGVEYGYHVQPGDDTEVKFEITFQNGNAYLLFVNKLDSGYPVYSQGTYILRKTEAGIDQVKVYYQSDEGCFIRFRPAGGASEADIYVYGRQYRLDIEIPIPFQKLILESFAEVMERSRGMVDWGLLFPSDTLYGQEKIGNMVREIRKRLPTLEDSDDGALDADGSPVFIETLQPNPDGGLNCSGFAKWVADGVYAGLIDSRRPEAETGAGAHRYLSVADMKARHPDIRGNRWSEPFEGARDPFFGLDWIRNLSVSIMRLDSPDAGIEAADVRYPESAGYIEDVGYPVENLLMVLYMDAVRNPGFFYLGSVNRPTGTEPILQQHTHVAVFFPFFNDEGIFSIAVMERNRESDFEAFIAVNNGAHVHLARIKAPDRFLPPGDIRGATINR